MLRDRFVAEVFLWLGMQASFKVGRALFPHYLDLQRVSLALGYHRYGLGSLTGRVLGFTLPKPRKVSMSNWEARRLTQDQIIYAALDALIAGQIFRALRLWHSSTSACSTCHSLIGSLVECSSLRQVLQFWIYLEHRGISNWASDEGVANSKVMFALEPEVNTIDIGCAVTDEDVCVKCIIQLKCLLCPISHTNATCACAGVDMRGATGCLPPWIAWSNMPAVLRTQFL